MGHHNTGTLQRISQILNTMLHENFHNVLKVLKSLARDMPIGSYSEMWGKFSNSVFWAPLSTPALTR